MGVDDTDKLCKFHENMTTNAERIVQMTNANFQLRMVTFPLLIVRIFFFKINRVEAIDEMGKLCKFHVNPTKNVDLIA